MKDTRRQYNNQRIAHEGNVWFIDAKLDTATGKVTVSNIYGDVTDRALLDEAIQSWIETEAFRLESGPRQGRGRPRKAVR